MKKLIAMTLAIVLVFGLCACSQNDNPQNTGNNNQTENNQTENNQTENNQTSNAESTGPVTPREEELAVLDAYEYIIEELYKLQYSGNAVTVKSYYDQLSAMDFSVIDKWVGTEYASADVNWDYKTVLSSFVIHKDVLLGYKLTESDTLGNSSTTENNFAVVYDVNGFAHKIDVPLVEVDERYSHNCQESLSVVNGQFSFYEDDPMDLCVDDYRATYYLREDGKIDKVEYRGQYTSEIEYLRTPTYDTDGKVISETVLTGMNTYPYAITYIYDDQGRLEEICTESERSDSYKKSWITYEYDEEGRLFFIARYDDAKSYIESDQFLKDYLGITRACAWELYYDDNGQLTKIAKAFHEYDQREDKWKLTYSLTHDISCDENGRILSESGKNSSGSKNITREFIYGDYYIFNPSTTDAAT
ncbi:MAG: hypothetical protein IJD93_03765 [Ruminococcus sp.]|nr:hypothetical protein [Ruminococcus sp.]